MIEPTGAGARLRKDSRIGIIGGGCGGVHLAHLLKQRGFAHVTVLEREQRIGGKACSPTHRGFPHEMGACYIPPHYSEFIRLMARYGVGRLTAPKVYERSVFTTALGGGLREHHLASFVQGTYDALARADKMPRGGNLTRLVALLGAIRRYHRLRRRLLGQGYHLLARRPSPAAMAELALPFMDMVERHRLHAMLPYFWLASSGQGYGVLETIPTLYALLWNQPALVSAFVLTRLGLSRRLVVQMVDVGTQTLFERIAAEDRLDVRLGVTVRSVLRPEAGPITVVAETPEGPAEFVFDDIVVATDFRASLQFLGPEANETELFQAQTASTFVTNLIETPRWAAGALKAYVIDALMPRAAFSVAGVRDIHFSWPDAQTDRCAAVAYQYVDRPPDAALLADLEARLKPEMARLGFADVTLVQRRQWSYFPRFTADGVARGLPWEVFERQGRNRTWYAGSSACFESLNDVMNYNLLLMQTFAEA